MSPSFSHALALTVVSSLASLVNTVFNLLKEAFYVLLGELISFFLRVDQDALSALIILAVLVQGDLQSTSQPAIFIEVVLEEPWGRSEFSRGIRRTGSFEVLIDFGDRSDRLASVASPAAVFKLDNMLRLLVPKYLVGSFPRGI